jgi:hypothetical protein
MRETLAVSGAGWISSRILRSRARPSPIHDPAGGPEQPGASRIRPGFRGQKGQAEAGFCPLKAGGVPGQGPGASRPREAAPGPPRFRRARTGTSPGLPKVLAGFSPSFRRVGKVARGPESEGARGSAGEAGDAGAMRYPETLTHGRSGRQRIWMTRHDSARNFGAVGWDAKKL